MEPRIDPWALELIVVRHSHDSRARSVLSRDAARGLLRRLRHGVYVDRVAFESLTIEGQHVVRMRALDAVTDGPVVFSHFSAALAQGLPVLYRQMQRAHVTTTTDSGRSRTGVAAHLLALDVEEVREVHGLLLTSIARTVVDCAAAGTFDEGVMVADAALCAGVPRELLDDAVDRAARRRAARRIDEVVRFAHPGAESAAESQTRVTCLRLGVEPPVLQHRLVLLDGSEVFLDLLFPSVRVGGEVDGAKKLLDPAISTDARAALVREKRREDAVRLQLAGLARWGWAESGSVARLGPILRQVGVLPAEPRATLEDYAAEAGRAIPRRPSRSLCR